MPSRDNAASYVDTSLPSGTTNYYRVKTGSFGGESSFSAEVAVKTGTNGTGIPFDALKVWLKADSGLGETAVNCWVDQTTNLNNAYFSRQVTSFNALRDTNGINHKPAVYFFQTNALDMLNFATGWTQGEVLVVVQSLGADPNSPIPLWRMGGPSSLPNQYPTSSYHIYEDFGSAVGYDAGTRASYELTAPHIWNVASASNFFVAKTNNAIFFSGPTNTVTFATLPRLGWGANGNRFRGYIGELMIFNRVLDTSERD